MPPKKPEVKKISKKERDAEEKRRIEEENRVATELALKLKLQREKEEREAREEFFKERGSEVIQYIAEFTALHAETSHSITTLLANLDSSSKWNDYQKCSSLPSPLDQRDMNTYFSTINEIPPVKASSINFTLLKTQLSDLNELAASINDQINSNTSTSDVPLLRSFLDEIDSICIRKINYFTAFILQHIDHFVNDISENCLVSSTMNETRLCIWSNLTKNPRHNSVAFDAQSVNLNLTKNIMVESCAIRVIHDLTSAGMSKLERAAKNAGLLSVNGVCWVELIAMPEFVKGSAGWKIRDDYEIIKNVELGTMKGGDDGVSGSELNLNASSNNLNSTVGEEPPAIQFPFLVSIGVLRPFDPENVLAYMWDEATQRWSQEGILDLKIEDGVCSVRTVHFKPFILAKPLYSEFPLISWEVSKAGNNCVNVTLVGAKSQISFEISEEGCLLNLELAKTLGSVFDKPFKNPKSFLETLSLYGYHYIAPTINTDIMPGKDTEAIKSTLFSLCLLSNHFNFKRNTFNRDLSVSKIAIDFLSVDLVEVVEEPVKTDEDMVITDSSASPLPIKIDYKTLFLDTKVTHGEAQYALCQKVTGSIDDKTMINFKTETVYFSVFHLLKGELNSDVEMRQLLPEVHESLKTVLNMTDVMNSI